MIGRAIRGALVGPWVLCAAPTLACTLPLGIEAIRADLLAGTNARRAEAGLPALSLDARLTEAAQDHACHGAERERVSHRGTWFAGLARRLRRVDYPFATAVENLAAGLDTAPQAVAAWAASPEHRANLLNPQVREAGFGIARADNGWLHWVMIAGARQ